MGRYIVNALAHVHRGYRVILHMVIKAIERESRDNQQEVLVSGRIGSMRER